MEQLSALNKVNIFLSNWIETHSKEDPETVNKIIEIFKNFYGEDHVDTVNIVRDILGDIEKCLSDCKLRELGHDSDNDLISEGFSYTLLDLFNSDYPNFLKFKMFRKAFYYIKNILSEIPNKTKVIIHIPKKEVVNEEGESTIIYDVYVTFYIQQFWIGYPKVSKFTIARSTYSEEEIHKGYIHSHVPSARAFQNFCMYHKPCLGNGSILSTMSTICSGIYDIEIWHLFALELDLFLGTESLSGGPYIKLSSLKKEGSYFLNSQYLPDTLNMAKKDKNMLLTGLSEVLNHNDLIGFDGCSYFLTKSLEEFVIDINEVVDKKFPIEMQSKSNIKNCKLNDKGELRIIENIFNEEVINEVEGLTLNFDFKGEKIPIKVIKSENDDVKIKTYKIINYPQVYMYLYKSIINAINIKNINHE